MIVVDANLIGYLFLQNEFTPLTIQVFEKDPDWYAPLLWQSEVRNIVTKYFRKELLTLEQIQHIINEAHDLMTDHERLVASSSVLELMAKSRCTAYDCEYVALAKEMKFPLVTFDKDVVRDFPQIAKFPQDFIRS